MKIPKSFDNYSEKKLCKLINYFTKGKIFLKMYKDQKFDIIIKIPSNFLVLLKSCGFDVTLDMYELITIKDFLSKLKILSKDKIKKEFKISPNQTTKPLKSIYPAVKRTTSHLIKRCGLIECINNNEKFCSVNPVLPKIENGFIIDCNRFLSKNSSNRSNYISNAFAICGD
jgi:ribosome-associated translation inhibitor RaiA